MCDFCLADLTDLSAERERHAVTTACLASAEGQVRSLQAEIDRMRVALEELRADLNTRGATP